MSTTASVAEIKAAYRALAKRHHPDVGGDEQRFLALNAAWEVLGDPERRRRHDHRSSGSRVVDPAPSPPASDCCRMQEEQRLLWLQQVVVPIDRWLGQVINPFAAELKALAADPYDDRLMEQFSAFLEVAVVRLARAESLYNSRVCPLGLEAFSLDLYHCLSLVKDALCDLERYTQGYVDSYLRDGRELLRQAKIRRLALQADVRQFKR